MRFIVLVSVVAGAAFVWLTGARMPPLVASHFAANGVADGAMSRGAYLALMLGVVVLVPAVIAAPATFLRGAALRFLNLPNRDHWLAPERRDATLRSLASRSQWFACVAVVFFCVLHHEVVAANLRTPPRLGGLFVVAVAVFVATTVAWTVLLMRRFAIVR